MELCPANIYLKSLNPNEEPKVREIPGRIRPAEERPIAPSAHSTKKNSPRLATTTRRKRISAGPGARFPKYAEPAIPPYEGRRTSAEGRIPSTSAGEGTGADTPPRGLGPLVEALDMGPVTFLANLGADLAEGQALQTVPLAQVKVENAFDLATLSLDITSLPFSAGTTAPSPVSPESVRWSPPRCRSSRTWCSRRPITVRRSCAV